MSGGSDAPESRIIAQTPSLVARLRSGEDGAGRMLDLLYRDPLVRFCWGYLGQIEEAEDAVQDLFCKVLADRSIPDSFRPWLYRLARNHCLNLLRGRGRRLDRGEMPDASQVMEALTGHLTRMARDERERRLSELIQSLSESQREILRLRYVEDLSRKEIAEVLEIPESLIKSRLFQGMRQLREWAAELDPS